MKTDVLYEEYLEGFEDFGEAVLSHVLRPRSDSAAPPDDIALALLAINMSLQAIVRTIAAHE